MTLPIGFSAGGSAGELDRALGDLCAEADKAIEAGRNILILSDRDLPGTMTPIPSLLAVSVVNRHLSRNGKRTRIGLIAETGESREVMHMALLLGYGATAINPYLAFETIAEMASRRDLSADIAPAKALENYVASLCEGLRKVMSKMGISTLRSYRGAQVFEAVGLDPALVDLSLIHI